MYFHVASLTAVVMTVITRHHTCISRFRHNQAGAGMKLVFKLTKAKERLGGGG